MDELEISGKRYISTRRAAKEHKYSSDYIGQLVRNKKVVGQKVGRSWYVDARSLAEYLDGEKKLSAKPAHDDIKKVSKVAKAENETSMSTDILEEKIMAIPQKPAPAARLQEEIGRETAHYIPINIRSKKGLVYLSDEGEVLPHKASIEKKKKLPVEARDYKEVEVFPKEEREISFFARAAILLGIGIFIVSIVTGVSVWVSTTTIVEEGKPVTVELSTR